MKHTRQEYESLINGSSLFDIDRERDFALYNTEKNIFVTELAEYYRDCVYKPDFLENYSLELMESISECLKYFDKNKGTPFLHYLNKTLSKNIGISKAKNLRDEKRRGLTVGEKRERMIGKIIAFAHSKGIDVRDRTSREHIAECLGISVEDVAELMLINENAAAVNSTVTTGEDEEEETTLIDLLPARTPTPEEIVIRKDSLRSLAARFDEGFSKLQNRPTTRKIISMFLTARFTEFIENRSMIAEILFGMSFADEVLLIRFERDASVPSLREIAAECGVSESSANRTIRNFIDGIKRPCD